MSHAGRTAELFARALLVLYPRDFRHAAGAELVDAHRQRGATVRRRDGRAAYVLWLARAAAALVASAPGAWRERTQHAPAWRPDEHRRLHATKEFTMARDLRHAQRGLLRTPGYTLVVLLTLGLGIGGTTAVYTVVRAVLVQPLHYRDSQDLVRVYQPEWLYLPAPHLLHVREHATTLDDVAYLYTYDDTHADIMVAGQAERIPVLRISANYFDVLGQTPLAGRVLTREEEGPFPLAVASERLLRRLPPGAGPGTVLEVDGETVTIVGVMPAGFEDPLMGAIDLWVPEPSAHEEGPGNFYLSSYGRLAPGATLAQARAELAVMNERLDAEFGREADEPLLAVRPLHEDIVAEARPVLLLLLGAVGVVLLIAVVNVANLQMVRALGRTREMAVRSALGAGRARLLRHLLTESLLLAVAGGALGVGVAVFGVTGLLRIGADAVPRGSEVALDGNVLAFTLAVSLLTGLFFGLLPALRAARSEPAQTLRAQGRGTSSSRAFVRTRGVLVAAQVALALVLLTGATVLATSLQRLQAAELGISDDAVLAFELNLPAARYDGPARAAFHQRVLARLEALPGVRHAGATNWLPVTGSAYNWGTRAASGPLAGTEDAWVQAEQRVVDGAYFEAVGLDLLQGRLPDARDVAGADTVVAISNSLAREAFPGVDALGQRLGVGGAERRVVGVVEDVARDPEGEVINHVYHPHPQFAGRAWTMNYLVATSVPPMSVLAEVRRAVAAEDPRLVVHAPTELAKVLGRGRGTRRFAFVLSVVFAALALALAVLGIYGVLAYTVRQRRREIGIRLALGAGSRQVAGLVVRQGLLVVAAGLVLGVGGALALGQVLTSLVYETSPADPRLMALSAAVLSAAAAAACLVPALRALRVEVRGVLEEG